MILGGGWRGGTVHYSTMIWGTLVGKSDHALSMAHLPVKKAPITLACAATRPHFPCSVPTFQYRHRSGDVRAPDRHLLHDLPSGPGVWGGGVCVTFQIMQRYKAYIPGIKPCTLQQALAWYPIARLCPVSFRTPFPCTYAGPADAAPGHRSRRLAGDLLGQIEAGGHGTCQGGHGFGQVEGSHAFEIP